MNRINSLLLTAVLCLAMSMGFSQSPIPPRSLTIKKTTAHFKIDGVLDEPAWKTASVADKFVALRPTPFKAESEQNRSEVYFLYDEGGIYVGGFMHEPSRDSVAAELVGRDGFGNNDFIGVVFDTYHDKLNGFEYFITPLGEQFDAKTSPNNEDFSWNAVWQSGAKLVDGGWTFEMYIPYSAIRFGKKDVQHWGLNLVRKRQKAGEQLFWRALDPNVNGFLTQEGELEGLEHIVPPLRLQLSPYFSIYQNHDGTLPAGTDKSKTLINGGMDVKYGINQAFTLDMTLIPDFGQVQTDNRVLNLSPFEQRFSENRTFFTEGTELFNKGNLFYSRRIGRVGDKPLGYYSVSDKLKTEESILKNPDQIKLLNATKISGRTQKGLGIGILNAITKPQDAVVVNNLTGEQRKIETEPLTNYNIIVLDQSLKHNSSISLVNTNVTRNGSAPDANVSAFLFDMNDKKNMWNIGGNVSISNIFRDKVQTGYAHSIYMGKTSGAFNFNVWQDLFNAKYDKSDMGFFTNNNTMDQGAWFGYSWTKPKGWYNQIRANTNFYVSRLVTPMDDLKRKSMMFQNAGINFNFNAQTKKLWWFGFNFNTHPKSNDFYEARTPGRVFQNGPRSGGNIFYESNFAKKFYFNGYVFAGKGGYFKGVTTEWNASTKYRFSPKFSIDHSLTLSNVQDQAGFAAIQNNAIYFSRRDVKTVENSVSLKYNFTNKMGLNLRTRHYWGKVTPLEYYELDTYGKLQTPATALQDDYKQNFNYLSTDLIYSWQFAQGSFVNLVWKDIGQNYNSIAETKYVDNFKKTVSGNQFNSLSLRIIYFLDYLTVKNKLKKG